MPRSNHRPKDANANAEEKANVPNDLLDKSFGYAIQRKNGDWVRLIPADRIPGLDGVVLGQRDGLILLPLPRALSPRTVKGKAPKDGRYILSAPGDPIDHHYLEIHGGKLYCKEWILTGICHLMTQSCDFLHVIPQDIAVLRELGIGGGRMPKWWKDHIEQLEKLKHEASDDRLRLKLDIHETELSEHAKLAKQMMEAYLLAADTKFPDPYGHFGAPLLEPRIGVTPRVQQIEEAAEQYGQAGPTDEDQQSGKGEQAGQIEQQGQAEQQTQTEQSNQAKQYGQTEQQYHAEPYYHAKQTHQPWTHYPAQQYQQPGKYHPAEQYYPAEQYEEYDDDFEEYNDDLWPYGLSVIQEEEAEDESEAETVVGVESAPVFEMESAAHTAKGKGRTGEDPQECENESASDEETVKAASPIPLDDESNDEGTIEVFMSRHNLPLREYGIPFILVDDSVFEGQSAKIVDGSETQVQSPTQHDVTDSDGQILEASGVLSSDEATADRAEAEGDGFSTTSGEVEAERANAGNLVLPVTSEDTTVLRTEAKASALLTLNGETVDPVGAEDRASLATKDVNAGQVDAETSLSSTADCETGSGQTDETADPLLLPGDEAAPDSTHAKAPDTSTTKAETPADQTIPPHVVSPKNVEAAVNPVDGSGFSTAVAETDADAAADVAVVQTPSKDGDETVVRPALYDPALSATSEDTTSEADEDAPMTEWDRLMDGSRPLYGFDYPDFGPICPPKPRKHRS